MQAKTNYTYDEQTTYAKKYNFDFKRNTIYKKKGQKAGEEWADAENYIFNTWDYKLAGCHRLN